MQEYLFLYIKSDKKKLHIPQIGIHEHVSSSHRNKRSQFCHMYRACFTHAVLWHFFGLINV